MVDRDRYARQLCFAPIGVAGQERLARARVLQVGCGALGSVAAEQLVRAGVGAIRLVDRDLLEASNLQRQGLYTEADVAAGLPKSVALAAHLQAINSACRIDAAVVQVEARSLSTLLDEVDLVIDGTDNFATRHLLNDACCQRGLPWVYAACVGAYAISFPILPGTTACLRCLQDELPAAGDGPTCETAGIIAPAVHLAAAWQVAEALKLLIGDRQALRQELWACDCWQGRLQRLDLGAARDPACRSCGAQADHPALHLREPPLTVLCGREAVQVQGGRAVDLAAFADALGERLRQHNAYLVRWRDGALEGTLFTDGRVLVQGTADGDRARAFVDRWLG